MPKIKIIDSSSDYEEPQNTNTELPENTSLSEVDSLKAPKKIPVFEHDEGGNDTVSESSETKPSKETPIKNAIKIDVAEHAEDPEIIAAFEEDAGHADDFENEHDSDEQVAELDKKISSSSTAAISSRMSYNPALPGEEEQDNTVLAEKEVIVDIPHESSALDIDPSVEETPEEADLEGALPNEAVVEEKPDAKPNLQPSSYRKFAKKEIDEDPYTQKAVDDIAKKDSDELMERQDEDLALASQEEKKSFIGKVKGFFGLWWRTGWARWLTIFVILLSIAAAIALPVSRYFMLNLAGVRASASLTVLDEKTGQPLKNAKVKIGPVEAITNSQGSAKLQDLRLGPTTLKVEKRAFSNIEKQITVGWGSNPLGEQKVVAVGDRYVLEVIDWLSSKPIEKAEVATESGDAAISDKDGRAELVLDKSDDSDFEVSVLAAGYRKEMVKISPTGKTSSTKVKVVPDKKHLFVSNRSGKYDVYSIDADGKNERKLVQATGLERNDMTLVPHSNGKVAAMVATRENTRNKDGFLLSTLYFLDVESGELEKVEQSERIQVVDWVGGRLVYVAIAQGASGTNPKRHRLITVDYQSGAKKELAASNYFNDVLVAGGKIYYAPSNAFLENPANARLFRVDADGNNQTTVLDKEVWNVFRTEYDKLSIAQQQNWYSYKVNGTSVEKLQSAPGQLKTKIFIDNPMGGTALWTEERDGKGVLLLHDVKSGTDKVLKTQSGLTSPVRWLTDTYAVYRIASATETADYVISTNGGEPVKIKDVSNIGGIDKWYYYQ